MKWMELGSLTNSDTRSRVTTLPQDDFTLENTFAPLRMAARFTPVLLQTPWFFRMTPPWHLSYFDELLLDGLSAMGLLSAPG